MSTGIAVAFARSAMVTAGLAWELAEASIAEDQKLFGSRAARRPRRW